MPANQTQILCVGNDPNLLEIHGVLERAGYPSLPASIEDAEVLLRTEKFELVILSTGLSDDENGRILYVAGDTPALVFPELTLPQDLLSEVGNQIARKSARSPQLTEWAKLNAADEGGVG